MKVLEGSRPTPAIIVAVVALVFAVAGTAVAGTDGLVSKVSRSKVKSIAKKEIAKAAPGLSVAKAVNADNATNATNATNAQNATNAENATNATNAQNATNATNAQNASQLGGVPAAAHVRQVEIITGNGPGFTSANKDFSVSCPPGKTVIGGGAQINSNPPNVLAITASRPALNGLTWHAAAVETEAYADNWELQAFLVCAVTE